MNMPIWIWSLIMANCSALFVLLNSYPAATFSALATLYFFTEMICEAIREAKRLPNLTTPRRE